jgi:hypothetical protein
MLLTRRQVPMQRLPLCPVCTCTRVRKPLPQVVIVNISTNLIIITIIARLHGYSMNPSHTAPQLAGKLHGGDVSVPPAIIATAASVPPLPGR